VDSQLNILLPKIPTAQIYMSYSGAAEPKLERRTDL
jgi:hypothetical protein